MYCACQKCDKKCKQIIKQLKTTKDHKDTQKFRQMMKEHYLTECFKDVNIEERYLDDKLEIVSIKKPKINDKLYEYVYYKYEYDYVNGDENFHIYLSKEYKEYIDPSYYIRNIHNSKNDVTDIDTNIQAFKTKHVKDEEKGFGVYFEYI